MAGPAGFGLDAAEDVASCSVMARFSSSCTIGLFVSNGLWSAIALPLAKTNNPQSNHTTKMITV